MANSTSAKGKGRKKIKMEKMQNQSNLQVTFSKRRKSVSKKAYELSILTGAEVALIVFSPGGKVYTYGHPTIDSVIHRFLNGIPQPLTLSQKISQDDRNVKVIEINTKFDEVKSKIEKHKKRREEAKKLWAECQFNQGGNIYWNKQNLSQTQQLVEAVKNTKDEVEREINTRVYAQKNNMQLAIGYNDVASERRFHPLSLVEPTYKKNGSNNTCGVTYVGNNIDISGSKFHPSLLRHNGYVVGTSGNKMLGLTGLGFNGNGSELSFSYEHSLVSGNDGGNGTFNAGLNSFIGGGGGLPNTYMASSSRAGAGGLGWPLGGVLDQHLLCVGPSTYVGGCNGDDLPKNFIASSTTVGDEDSGLTNTYMGNLYGVGGYGLDWSLHDVPNQLGHFADPSYCVKGRSDDSFPSTYKVSSSASGNGGCGSFSNPYMDSSFGVGGGDLGLSFSVVPNPLGQFNGSNTYVGGGSGDGLPITYSTSPSYFRNNNGSYGGLPNTYTASSSAPYGVGLGRSLSDFSNPLGEFNEPNTYIGDGLSNTYGASLSGLGSDDDGFNDRDVE